MDETILVLDVLGAALAAGMNMDATLRRVSDLVRARHAAGGVTTQDDLKALFSEGDELEAQVRAKIEAALADPNTPPAGVAT